MVDSFPGWSGEELHGLQGDCRATLQGGRFRGGQCGKLVRRDSRGNMSCWNVVRWGISSKIAKVVSSPQMLHGAGIFTNIFTRQNHQVNIYIYLYFIDGAYGIDIDGSWVGHGYLDITGIYNLTDQVGRSSRSGTMAIPTAFSWRMGIKFGLRKTPTISCAWRKPSKMAMPPE